MWKGFLSPSLLTLSDKSSCKIKFLHFCREDRPKVNITDDIKGTISYVSPRTFHFDPEKSVGDPKNDTYTMLNVPCLVSREQTMCAFLNLNPDFMILCCTLWQYADILFTLSTIMILHRNVKFMEQTYIIMVSWVPEGRYRCTKSMVIAPFLFSTEHLWIVIVPFWLSTDNILGKEYKYRGKEIAWIHDSRLVISRS